MHNNKQSNKQTKHLTNKNKNHKIRLTINEERHQSQKGLKMKTQDTQFGIKRNFLFGVCDECSSNSQNLIKVHIVGYGLTQNDLSTPTIQPRLVRYLTVYPENSDKAWNVECSHEEWVVFHRMTLPVQVRLCPHDLHIVEEYPRTDNFDPDTNWAEEIRKQTEED